MSDKQDILTPKELEKVLSFHFSEAQAIAIAEHVYQPIYNLLQSEDV